MGEDLGGLEGSMGRSEVGSLIFISSVPHIWCSYAVTTILVVIGALWSFVWNFVIYPLITFLKMAFMYWL